LEALADGGDLDAIPADLAHDVGEVRDGGHDLELVRGVGRRGREQQGQDEEQVARFGVHECFHSSAVVVHGDHQFTPWPCAPTMNEYWIAARNEESLPSGS